MSANATSPASEDSLSRRPRRVRGLRTRLRIVSAAVAIAFLALALVRARERQLAEQQVLGNRAQDNALTAGRAIDAGVREVRTLLESVDLTLSEQPASSHDRVLKALGRRTPLPYDNLFSVELAENGHVQVLGATRDTATAFVAPTCLERAANTRGFTVCPADRGRDAARGRWTLTFVQPAGSDGARVPPPANRFVAARIAVDSLDAVRLARQLPEGSVLTMLDAAGVVMIRTLEADKWIGRPFPDFPTRERDLQPVGSDTVVNSEIDQRKRLFGSINSAETGWRIFVGIPVEEAFGPSRRQFVQDILIAAAFSLAILLLGNWMSARIVHPIESLTTDALAISDGDMSRRSHVRGEDEVGTLARSFNQMADAIVERNSELAESQERLRQVQKLEALGAFAGGVAHEFNNYLSSILGHAELALMDDRLPATVREEIGGIVTSSQRATELTRQVMVFSRRQVVSSRVVPVMPAVHEMARLLDRLTGDRITLSVHVSAHVRAVYIDPGQLEQVMMNLAVNARDAMPGRGTLSITVDHASRLDRERLSLGESPFVRFTVTDSGSGVPESLRAHIFEPFFTTKDRDHGTGLGLSISYGIVKAAGGAIELDANTAQGASFHVYLPEHDLPVAQAPDAPAAAPAALGASGEKLLLVEDDASVAEVARRLLTRAGYDVSVMRNAESALEALEQHTYDLLLSDVVMPGMSGAALVQEAKRRHTSLRVVLMSGYPDDDLVAHEIAAQRVAFLAKPFSQTSLLTMVRDVLDAA